MEIRFFKYENDYYLKIADLTAVVRDRLINLPFLKDKEVRFNTSNFSRLIPLKKHCLEHKYDGVRLMIKSKPPARTFILVDDLLKYNGEHFRRYKRIYTKNEVLNIVLQVLKETQELVALKKEKYIKECEAHIKSFENTLFIDNPFCDEAKTDNSKAVKTEADERPPLTFKNKEIDENIVQMIKNINNKIEALEKRTDRQIDALKLLISLVKNGEKKKFLGLF